MENFVFSASEPPVKKLKESNDEEGKLFLVQS